MMAAMKIFLADDHQLFLEGMYSVLANMGGDVQIDTAKNGREAFERLTEGVYDIALIDIRLPNLDGFSLLRELSNTNNLTPVIIVTASEDPQDIQLAIDLGAMGFVPKSSTGQQIVTAIKCVLRGEVVRPGGKGNSSTNDCTNWAHQHDITPRQLEVLRLIRHGLSNQAIADKLHLSTATVKTHIMAIFQALNTQSRTETIRKAQQLGLD